MNPLVASILANPSAHQVNRKEKMDKTLDVMANNLIKKEHEKSVSDGTLSSEHFGYNRGTGRGTGD